MSAYPLAADLVRPVLRVRMPRARRLIVPGGTIHVVSRCNNREFSFTTAEDFRVLLDRLCEMGRTYEVTLYAFTLMSNHVHLLLQAPRTDALGRPLRWFLTQTAKAFHKTRGVRAADDRGAAQQPGASSPPPSSTRLPEAQAKDRAALERQMEQARGEAERTREAAGQATQQSAEEQQSERREEGYGAASV